MLSLISFLGCSGTPKSTDPATTAAPAESIDARFATFNTSLHRDREGRLVTDLTGGEDEQARGVAAILQEVRPDVVLLNEVDWDADGEALRLLQTDYLAVGQDGREPLQYAFSYLAPTNTGLNSGVDLDGDGNAETTPGSTAYGNDSFGFGEFHGQYGFVVLSQFEIDVPRTFQSTLWKDIPNNTLPPHFYSDAALQVFRLSSKNHVDLPLRVGSSTVHFLVSHPTPPSFDGPEDRNGRRNADEISFWTSYLDAASDSWHIDDAGRVGGLNGASFVIAGDLNADPVDGGTDGIGISNLLSHTRVNDTQPTSPGGTEQSALQGQENANHLGDPALDTADFNDNVGNLRVDFVLPSTDLDVRASGVFWPAADDPLFPLVGTFPYPVSDHRPVWVDLTISPPE